MNPLSNQPSLNSATKYPEIETYHELGQRGRLNETVTPFEGVTYYTEKVDGTNGRIILLPGGDYVIGAREHLLHAKGDRVVNPGMSIAPTLIPLADSLVESGTLVPTWGARVLYLEVYGGKVGGHAKQYSGTGKLAYRLFDIMEIEDEPLTWDPAKISTWRKSGGQYFLWVTEMLSIAKQLDIPTVPYLGTIDAAELPQTHQETYDFLLDKIPNTLVGLDDKAKGRPEGLVLRSADRTTIRKARFADYRYTLNIN